MATVSSWCNKLTQDAARCAVRRRGGAGGGVAELVPREIQRQALPRETWVKLVHVEERQRERSVRTVDVSVTATVQVGRSGGFFLTGNLVDPVYDDAVVESEGDERFLADKHVVQVAVTQDNVMALTESGEVHAMGYGGGGVMGLGDEEDQEVPRLVGGPLADVRVVQVSMNSYHSLVVTSEGHLFSFGHGRYGRLGHGSEENELRPRRVRGALEGEYVVCAAAGRCHSVVCTKSGAVYTFGQGFKGALGHCTEKDEIWPRTVAGELEARRVVLVSAGCCTSAAVTADGELFTWGSRARGALGHSPASDTLFVAAPDRVVALAHERVARVASGDWHMVVMTGSGRAYTFGCNADGELGRLYAEAQESHVPAEPVHEALGGERVVDVCAGFSSTAVTVSSGKVVAFGYGHGGIESTVLEQPV